MIGNMINTKNYIWCSAAIDFEGTIGLYHHKNKKNRLGYTWQPAIKLGNTNKDLLREFARITKGFFREKETKDKRANNKPYWQIILSPNCQRVILPRIFPYLISKKEQALLLQEALDILGKRKPYDKPSFRLAEIAETLKFLNHKGNVKED